MKQSAGTILYRYRESKEPEVLLVHASGNYNRDAPWSIPKGEAGMDESLEHAARRETLEETGVEAGELVSVGSIRYSHSPKEVHGFAGPAPAGAAAKCNSWEVDRAEFVSLGDAYKVLHPEQHPFLDRLQKLLSP